MSFRETKKEKKKKKKMDSTSPKDTEGGFERRNVMYNIPRLVRIFIHVTHFLKKQLLMFAHYCGSSSFVDIVSLLLLPPRFSKFIVRHQILVCEYEHRQRCEGQTLRGEMGE